MYGFENCNLRDTSTTAIKHHRSGILSQVAPTRKKTSFILKGFRHEVKRSGLEKRKVLLLIYVDYGIGIRNERLLPEEFG